MGVASNHPLGWVVWAIHGAGLLAMVIIGWKHRRVLRAELRDFTDQLGEMAVILAYVWPLLVMALFGVGCLVGAGVAIGRG